MTVISAIHGTEAGPFKPPKGDSMAPIRPAKHSPHGALETAEFRLIFVVAFIGFLLQATASRLMLWRGHKARSPAERKRSIFAEALAATDRTVPFAFMS